MVVSGNVLKNEREFFFTNLPFFGKFTIPRGRFKCFL